MRPRMRGPIRMNFYPYSHQLGVGVEVEVEIDLEEQQVAIGSESYKMINMKTKKFEEVAFALGVLQGAVLIPLVVPQMQPM